MSRATSKSEHRFFMATAIWYLVTVFWAFAPSFYLLGLYEDSEATPTHLVIHGVVFTTWVMLYIVQVLLIQKNNYKLHMSLGYFGVIVMILMVPSGLFPSIYKVHIGSTTITGAGHNVFRLCFSYFFFVMALINRKQPFLHKRYMLGSMVMLMGAAIFRILMDLDLQDSQFFYKGLQVLPAVALFIFDLVTYKRLVLVDLFSVAAVFGIFFFASDFWLSGVGNDLMESLIQVFVLPFI